MSPYSRRGSNTRISTTASSSPLVAPNRSRSLDGLLDAEPVKAPVNVAESDNTPSKTQTTTRSCDELDKELADTNNETTEKKSNSMSLDTADIEDDKTSMYSSSSDSKRKRNFMDRCVNKVKNLIIKK